MKEEKQITKENEIEVEDLKVSPAKEEEDNLQPIEYHILPVIESI